MSSAHVSEAMTGAPSRSPSTSGRMPSGSRKAITWAPSVTTAEKAPLMRPIASRTASASEPGCSQMSAAITSVSDVVSSRTPRSASSVRSSAVLVRLPLCPSATVRPWRCRMTGCVLGQRDDPVVE